jgi:hypothetical protein
VTARNLSPGAQALSVHAKRCRKCDTAARAGEPPTKFCGAGFILFVAAVRARARRAVAA